MGITLVFVDLIPIVETCCVDEGSQETLSSSINEQGRYVVVSRCLRCSIEHTGSSGLNTLKNTDTNNFVKRNVPKSGVFQVHAEFWVQAIILSSPPARSYTTESDESSAMDFSNPLKDYDESKALLDSLNNLIKLRRRLQPNEVNLMTEIIVNHIKGLATVLDPEKENEISEFYQMQLLALISNLRSTLERSGLERQMIDELLQGRFRALRETSILKLAQMNVRFNVSDHLCKMSS